MRPGPIRSTPIDDFLAGADRSSDGERWEAIGAGIGLGGVVLAIGLLALLVLVHRGRRSEVRSVLLVAAGAGAMMLVGGAIEVAGTAMVLEVGWFDASTDGAAASGMMRLLGGLLVMLGLGDEVVPATDATTPPLVGTEHNTEQTAATPPLVGSDDDRHGVWRWAVGPSSAFGVVGAVLGVISFVFDGHTTSEGPRLVHATVNVVHVSAAGVWFGGIVGILVVAARRRTAFGPLLVGFSRVTTVAFVALFLAGAAMAVMILDGPGDLTGTEWGRRLVVKVAAVGVAALVGTYHHFVVVPRLSGGHTGVEQAARRTLTVEALVLAIAVVVSTLLTQASTT